MGSASRTALTAAKAAVATATGVKAATGVALLSAGRAIGDVPALRAALANPVADASAKEALVESALGSLESSAKKVLGAIVAERWSSADDLLAGIEEVGIRIIAGATKDAIEAELFAVGRAAQSNPELELALNAKRGGAEAKRSLVGAVLGGASDSTIEIVRHLVSQPRGRRIRALLASAQATVADERGNGVATLTVAAPIAAAQEKKIAAILNDRYGRNHHIDTIVDDSILGGFTVQVGDDTIDASIRSRLTELSSKLAG